MRGSGMGGGIGSILYSDRTIAAGPVETFTYNSVGHTVALSNSLGSVTDTDRYDAFGNIIASDGSSKKNRQPTPKSATSSSA